MHNPPGGRTCQYCKWFTLNDAKTGTCWRYPPVPFPVGPNRVVSYRPAVQPHHSCGEWALAIEMAREMPPAPQQRTQ